jgi:hypothetical protein
MDDEMPFASHITKRGRTYQYVRRVPEDIADGFAFSRVQRSLRTTDRATAYEAGARVHSEVEKQFAAARRKKGTTINIIPIDDWDWLDWSQLADWFNAVLCEEDWRVRLRNLPGAAFDTGVSANRFWRDPQTVRAHIELQARLREMTVSDYAEDRFAFVQGVVRRLGVPISRATPYFERFMGACLKAEIAFLSVFFDREGGVMKEATHPDAIKGKWLAAAARVSDQQVARILGAELAKKTATGRSLADCLRQWQADRKRANKTVTPHGLGEKENAIDEFEKLAKVRDIGEITRAQVVQFRDFLCDQEYKAPTVNKKVGHITTLLATAQRAGWIDTAISGGIYIDIPAGTNEREPFSAAELDAIFSDDVFRKGKRSTNPKAGGELEFWIPLISIAGGLITSEILQLGPDTVGPHPEHPEITCFRVTNAGGRSLKAFARKRYVPVRRELLSNGLSNLVVTARNQQWRTLWPAVQTNPNVDLVSNMFSSFWSDFLRNQLEITDPLKALYSFRHNFRDAMSAVGANDYEKNMLMGHAEVGTGRAYGAKKTPRVVDIVRLNDLVQGPAWPFFGEITWPSPR